jgi:hypothetical protein
LDYQLDGEEGRVLDQHRHLFDRGLEPIGAFAVTDQHAREQFHQFPAADGRAFMEPNSLGVDAKFAFDADFRARGHIVAHFPSRNIGTFCRIIMTGT